MIKMQNMRAGGARAHCVRRLTTVKVFWSILFARMIGASMHVMNITVIVCISVSCGAVLCPCGGSMMFKTTSFLLSGPYITPSSLVTWICVVEC